jgi:transposase
LAIPVKKSLEHPKASWLKRLEYQLQLEHYKRQGYPIIYMDESGFEKEVIRAFGYSPQGLPCIDKYNWQQKRKTNVIGALYQKTLFAIDYFKTNVNWKTVYNWFKHTLIPKLNRKCVIVMDNASFHKPRRIRKLLNRHGHRVLWLPPYSPDLNPIEKKWAEVKKLRQGWLEHDLNRLFNNLCCYSFKVD